jgi:hypothetical protein
MRRILLRQSAYPAITFESTMIMVTLTFLFLLTPLVTFGILFWKNAKCGAVVLALYLSAYILFTLFGDFITANHGGSDWRDEWCPPLMTHVYLAYSGRVRTEMTPFGVTYWPCILLDRSTWHKTRYGVFDEPDHDHNTWQLGTLRNETVRHASGSQANENTDGGDIQITNSPVASH